jgi:hypothetical protein
VRLKVDIIVVSGGALPIRAAKNATKTISITTGKTTLVSKFPREWKAGTMPLRPHFQMQKNSKIFLLRLWRQ